MNRAPETVDEEQKTEPSSPDEPSELGALSFEGVYLLTAESDSQAAVPGLNLEIDAEGITVRKPDGAVSAVMAWAQLSSVTARRRMRTPVGRLALVLEAATASKTHRFVVPAEDPEAVEREITRISGAGRSRARRDRPRSRVLLGLVTVILLAGVTLAILAATGTLKF